MEQSSKEEEQPRNQCFALEEASKQHLREEKSIFGSISDGESFEEESQGETSASESQSHDTENAMVGTPYQIRNMLLRKMLFINDAYAETVGTAPITKAKGIVDGKRGSDWSEDK